MNGFYLVGRVLDEPVKSESASGIPISRFRISVDRNTELGSEAETFEITVFRNLAEENFEVGEYISVTGRVSANNYEKDGNVRYNCRLIGNTIGRIK